LLFRRKLFRNHDGRGVGIARDQGGHDRRVHYRKTFHPTNGKRRINHRHFIDTHFAGSYRMVDAFCLAPDEIHYRLFRVRILAWKQFCAGVWSERFLGKNLTRQPDALQHHLAIVFLA